jgi:alpha-D-ribose 1-methylphosphonate 5-triphosphate diphosphatase
LYIITNGCLVTEHELLEGHDLVIEGNDIAAVRERGTYRVPAGAVFVDARGGFVAPGIIDIHSDYIEHIAAPRPTSIMDFGLSLRVAERELAAHGVTTMFHSLSIYKFTEFLANPIRSPENTAKLIERIDAARSGRPLIRHFFHARFEIDNVDRLAELEAHLEAGRVHLLSFMDHTPGQGQYRDLEKYRSIMKGYRAISDEAIDVLIERSRGREKIDTAGLERLARKAAGKGVAVASHDDDTVEKVRLMRELGASITEFPVTMDVAREAHALGMYTVAGAPNVLLGGSHAGNVSAEEAIRENVVDILCSDYYPAALLHAVFYLADRCGRDLVDAFKLVTLHPAQAVRMDDRIGSLEEGKRADVIVVGRDESDFPVITRAFVAGRPALEINYPE